MRVKKCKEFDRMGRIDLEDEDIYDEVFECNEIFI